MQMKSRFIAYAAAAMALFCACDDEYSDTTIITTTPNTNEESVYDMSGNVRGADISWITEMEDAGYKFYNAAGTETDCFELMRELGCNAIRLRVWVNPSNGYCNAMDVAYKAYRANALGLRLMIDFHYSDTWADPGKQFMPAAWKDLSKDEIVVALKEHTTKTLNMLKNLNITPEWVQIGNEVGSGMMWTWEYNADGDMQRTDGATSGYTDTNFAAYVAAGCEAAKAVFPNIKTIIHIQNAFYLANAQHVCNIMKANNVNYDIIGLSHYPSEVPSSTRGAAMGITDWKGANDAAISNIQTLATTYGKDVMLVEYGYDVNEPDEAKKCLQDIMDRTSSISTYKGVMYWEPECYNWNGYALGAFDADNKPTAALDPFAK